MSRIWGALLGALLIPWGGAQDEAPLKYSEISEQLGLGKADALLRDAKYWEAAVEYRNALLQPGDREAARIPFALALLAHGNADYAGQELRRAQLLYDGFERLSLELNGSFVDQLRKVQPDSPDGWGACAYAWIRAGDREAARKSLDRYVQSRGTDDFARALDRMSGKPVEAVPPSEKKEELTDLQEKAEKLPTAVPPIPKPGAPEVAGPSSFRRPMILKEETLEP